MLLCICTLACPLFSVELLPAVGSGPFKENIWKVYECFTEQTEQNKLNQSLFDACRVGNLEEVKRLVYEGADANVRGHKNLKPIHEAVKNGHRTVVAELFPKTDFEDTSDYTSLLVLSLQGNLETLEYLTIDCKLNIHAVTDNNHTLFHYASVYYKWLIKEKNAAEDSAKSAKFDEKISNVKQVIRYLKEQGVG
ncbi:MAG TPA: ankyrin repeat domain-containing protein, partial [Elusimicrobiales bacterium]|nr:ankyrin repeat domain-containing protein [Elusimicrobiales bacterium]